MKRILPVQVTLVLVTMTATFLSAQEFRSTIMGRVTDPSGAGVPNAKVAAIKTDTNTRSEERRVGKECRL